MRVTKFRKLVERILQLDWICLKMKICIHNCPENPVETQKNRAGVLRQIKTKTKERDCILFQCRGIEKFHPKINPKNLLWEGSETTDPLSHLLSHFRPSPPPNFSSYAPRWTGPYFARAAASGPPSRRASRPRARSTQAGSASPRASRRPTRRSTGSTMARTARGQSFPSPTRTK